MAKKRRRKPKVSLRALTRPYSEPIYAGTRLGETLQKQLKAERPAIIRHLLRNTPVQRVRLLGTPKPKAMQDLGGILIPTPAANNLVAELNWLRAVLDYHRQDIIRFVELRFQFEKAILLGDYESAVAVRQGVVDRLGHSWWTLETEFLLAQRQAGLEGNRRLCQRYQEEKNDWVRCFAGFYSLRIEEGLSAEDYDGYCDHFRATDDDKDYSRATQAYLSFRLNFHRFSDIGSLGVCLNIEESHSIVDRFLSYVRACQLCHVLGDHALRADIFQFLAPDANAFQDQTLRVLAGLTRPSSILRSDQSDALFPILHDYTEGRYAQSYEAAVLGIARHPGCFELYELAARSYVRAEKRQDLPLPTEKTLAAELLCEACSLLSRNADTPKSRLRLLKLSYQLDSLTLGGQIYAFVRRHEDGLPTEQGELTLACGASLPSPRLSTAVDDNDLAASYLARLSELYPNNAAVMLFTATRQPLVSSHEFPLNANLPKTRIRKYRARILERLGHHAEALAIYRELDKEAGQDPLLKADATTGLFNCYLKQGSVLESAVILAQAAMANPTLVPSIPVRSTLDGYPSRSDSEWVGNIAWPVLHHIGQRTGAVRIKSEQLFNVLDDFLTAHGVEKPTELRSLADKFYRPCLVYVLRHICVPDLLDSSIAYNNQEELEGERIKVCEWLADIDSVNRAAYMDEIARLASRATMREMTHQVGHSKIHVSTDGIKGSLTEAYIDRVRRCTTYLTLSAELRQGIDTIRFETDALKNVNIVLIDEGYRLFCQLFNEMKQLFIYSNEYGLDANLSQRIRHGTLLGELRGHFETASLVTKKSNSGEYRENSYWLGKIGVSDTGGDGPAAVLRQLSADVDTIAHDVRTRWIQIKGAANDNQGMFDYDLREGELETLYQALPHSVSEVAFIDYLLDALWQRTEKDLQSVRAAIEGRLKDLLFGALDRCQQALEGILPGERLAEFRSAVANCKTQLAYGLQSLANWFRVDHGQRGPSFRLPEFIDALVANVAKYCGPSELEVSRETTIERPFHGRLFRPLWDLLFILFDNIAKHAKLANVPVKLIVVEHSPYITLTIVNRLGLEVDREELIQKAKAVSGNNLLDEPMDLIRREGGSGFVKIHKILRYDLRCEDYNVDLDLCGQDDFQAAIRIPSRGMYDESSGH